MEALSACLLRDVPQEALGVTVIGIDEGQFVSWLVLAPSFPRAPLTGPLFHLCSALWVKLGSKR